MSIFITGNAGYLGKYVTEAFTGRGAITVGFDISREITPYENVCNPSDVDRVFQNMKATASPITTVVHLAAMVAVSDCEENPAEALALNTYATIELAMKAAEQGVKQFIFASSAAVYGESVLQFPCIPCSVYGWSKRLAEQGLKSIANATEMKVASMRIFNLAGGNHQSYTHILPNLIRAAKLDKPLTLTADPDKTLRDYIHPQDVASAMLKVWERENPPDYTQYDVGRGEGVSISDLQAEVNRLSGKPVKIIREGDRKGDAKTLIAQTVPLKGRGWEPECSLSCIVNSAWMEQQL